MNDKRLEMADILHAAYVNPRLKQCFFTGQNNAAVGRALGLENWDWTPQPTVNIEPYYWNTHTLALAFGCRPVFTSEGKEWVAPMISDASQIRDLRIPEVYAGRTGEILKLAAKFMSETDDDTLIRLPDIQSPLGVAELMWGEGFYLALLTNPDEVHELCRKIAAFTVDYIAEFKRITGKRYNAATHPQLWARGDGFYLSDDVNSMVSPEMHLEYSVTYINELTKKLGPLFYHSCTWTPSYLDNIEQVANVKAANWSVGTSTDPAEIIRRFSGRFLLAPHIGAGTHREEGITRLGHNFHDEAALVRYFLESMTTQTTMCIVLENSLLEDVGQIVKIYKIFEEYGYSPQQHGF